MLEVAGLGGDTGPRRGHRPTAGTQTDGTDLRLPVAYSATDHRRPYSAALSRLFSFAR